MKLSQLIKDATVLLDELGDLDVGMLTDEDLYCGHAEAIFYDGDKVNGEPLVLIRP